MSKNNFVLTSYRCAIRPWLFTLGASICLLKALALQATEQSTPLANTATGATPGSAATSNSQPLSASLPDNHPEPSLSYTAFDTRDPFESFMAHLALEEQNAPKNTAQRPKQATEEFDLEQYRLTAIISGTSDPRAMVEDVHNKGHILRIGSYLGKRNGKVIKILATGVTISEENVDNNGKKIKTTRTLTLPKTPLESP